jgi:hypothetical protein
LSLSARVRQKELLKIEAWQILLKQFSIKNHAANGCGLVDMPMGPGRSLDDVESTVLGFKPRASKAGQCRPRGWIAI